MKNSYDVIVVGGGPAGSTAAALLAKEGVDVLLVDKEQFPRYTVGESLIPHFWKFTDLLGVTQEIENAGFIRKSGGVVYWDNMVRKIQFKDFGYTRPGLHVERDEFDHILLNNAKRLGVEVVEKMMALEVADLEEEVSRVLLQPVDGTEVDKQWVSARAVIDATGQQCMISKQEDIKNYDSAFRFQSIWGYYDKADYYHAIDEKTGFENRRSIPPLTLVSSVGENWGWCWHIVMKEKVSIGLVLPKSSLQIFKESGDTIEERFVNMVKTVPVINETLAESTFIPESIYSIRDYSYRAEKLRVGNCYLVGDAAAFVDPISSAGVPMGMYAGILASWCVSNSLRRPHRKPFFAEFYEKTLGMRLDLFRLLAYPSSILPPELMQQGRDVIRMSSVSENQLVLAQSMVTNRGQNFPDLLEEMGYEAQKLFEEREFHAA